MKLTQNPFSLYDFLGYFIPGAFLIYFYLLIHADGNVEDFASLLQTIDFDSADTYLPLIIVSYLAGHFISFISSYTVEKYSIWRYGYPSKFLMGIPHDSYFPNKRVKTIIIRTIMLLLLLPVAFYDLLFGLLFRFNYWNNRKLDSFVIELIRQNASHAYSSISKKKEPREVNLKDQDFFTILYHYVLERNKSHSIKIQNYVALYGFLRSITFLFIIVFWFAFYQFLFDQTKNLNYWIVFGSLAFISYIFFLAFLKFYKRYSLETLMALTTLEH